MDGVVPGPPYPGAYRHYKGGNYVVHKIISNETDHKIVVLYESLTTKTLHVREVREFLEYVHPNADDKPSFYHHMNYEIKDCDECVPRYQMLNP